MHAVLEVLIYSFTLVPVHASKQVLCIRRHTDTSKRNIIKILGIVCCVQNTSYRKGFFTLLIGSMHEGKLKLQHAVSAVKQQQLFCMKTIILPVAFGSTFP